MTPEELAAEFDRSVANAKIGLETRPEQGFYVLAYAQAASMIRRHLCTPNPKVAAWRDASTLGRTPIHDAAADMLAALEEASNWDYGNPSLPNHIVFQIDKAIAKAKGTPDVN